MKKKSKYKPRPIISDPLNWVLAGLKPLSEVADEAIKLKLKNHDALKRLCLGEGDRDDANTVRHALNITFALTQTASLGSDWHEEIEVAMDAVQSMGIRGLETGRFLFKGPELTAVNLAMELHDAQLDGCTVAQLEAALKYVFSEIRKGHVRLIKGSEAHLLKGSV